MTHTHFFTEGTFPCLDPDRQKRYFHENRQSGFVRHSSTISRNSACCRWTRQSGRSACGCCKIRADRVKTPNRNGNKQLRCSAGERYESIIRPAAIPRHNFASHRDALEFSHGLLDFCTTK